MLTNLVSALQILEQDNVVDLDEFENGDELAETIKRILDGMKINYRFTNYNNIIEIIA